MGILKIPRITTAQRLTTGGGITPDEGELLFDTDNKKIYKGDGITLGGVEVGGGGGGLDYATTSGTATAYTATVSGVSSYTAGDSYLIKFHLTNTGNAPTIDITGAGAKTIVKNAADTVAAGDILQNKIYLITYDGTNFQLVTVLGGTGGGITKFTAGGTNTYTATGVPGVSAYTDGDTYLVRFTNGNTGSSNLSINGLTTKTLYKNNDGPLIGGDIWAGGEMLCIFNSSLDGFQCIGTSPNSLFAYVTNGEGVTITKGQVVYAHSGTGDRMEVRLANNTQDSTSAKTIGVVYADIPAGNSGVIIIQGLLTGLNILKPVDGFADGQSLYLGATNGSFTKDKPSAPNHLVYVATITRANAGNAGSMYVKIQNGYELDEIHDVQILNPLTGHYLYYDSTAPGLWKNSGSWQGNTIAVGKGGTGFSTYAVGDLLYANGTSSFDKLSAVAFGQVLVSAGTNTAPAWSANPSLSTLTLTSAGSLTLGTSGAGGNTGEIIFRNSSNTNTITLRTGATSAAGGYNIVFPTAAPQNGQYMQFTSAGIGSWVNGTVTGVTTMANIGATPNADGATISGSTLTLQPAGISFGGVVTAGLQTFGGAKTFSSAVTISTASNQLILSSGINQLTINSGTSAAARIYTVPDVGTGSTFVMNSGDQSIGGSKTFTLALTISQLTNQLTLGATNSTTINAPNAGGAKTYTIPNVGTTSNFLMSTGVQSFSSILSISQASNTPMYINLQGLDGGGTWVHTEGVTGGILSPPLPNGARLIFRQYGSSYATYIGRATSINNLLFAANGSFEFWTQFTENIRLTNNTILVNNGSGTLQQVIGPRKTGWTVATGTANRGTFATFTPQTISNPPTQAQVQTISDHVVILSQRMKALIDDLHATAGHGLIGLT